MDNSYFGRNNIIYNVMKVSDNTAISMPMRNLLSILAAVGIGVWSYFGIVERIGKLETDNTLMKSDLEKAV